MPFVLQFDSKSSLIVKQYSAEGKKWLEEAYKLGSLVSTNLGQGSFGVRRAEDVLQYLKNTCRKPLAETSFMEIGCADGYLLHRLQEMGAKEVMGCEPGPMALAGNL